jgi:hypothetical protein
MKLLKFLKNVIDIEMTCLVQICIKSTYFSFYGDIYEQFEGVSMGSPLSPIVVNIYMDNFEIISINTPPLKTKVWKRYVDDTNTIWPHGRDK